jgi:hypothetical protein
MGFYKCIKSQADTLLARVCVYNLKQVTRGLSFFFARFCNKAKKN